MLHTWFVTSLYEQDHSYAEGERHFTENKYKAWWKHHHNRKLRIRHDSSMYVLSWLVEVVIVLVTIAASGHLGNYITVPKHIWGSQKTSGNYAHLRLPVTFWLCWLAGLKVVAFIEVPCLPARQQIITLLHKLGLGETIRQKFISGRRRRRQTLTFLTSFLLRKLPCT